jgi:hypothetical protein
MVDVERYIHLQGRLTTHGAAEGQTKERRSLENLPVELQKECGRATRHLCRMALYRVNGWKGSLGYNIRHHSRNRTMYEWSGRSCLDSPFRRRHPVSLPEQKSNPVFSFGN